jgi:predicted TPR repeat methyltransferase
VSSEWDDYADGWDTDEAVQAYAEAEWTCLTRHLDGVLSLDGVTAVDFGCGTGLLSERLSATASAVVAVDTSEKMLEVLQQKALPGVVPFHGDAAAAVTAHPGPYDLIAASSVCAFLDDYPGTVRLLSQSLKPGGLFVQWDWEWDPDDPSPIGFTRSQIRTALATAGLEVLAVETAFERPHGGKVMRPLIGLARR